MNITLIFVFSTVLKVFFGTPFLTIGYGSSCSFNILPTTKDILWNFRQNVWVYIYNKIRPNTTLVWLLMIITTNVEYEPALLSCWWITRAQSTLWSKIFWMWTSRRHHVHCVITHRQIVMLAFIVFFFFNCISIT